VGLAKKSDLQSFFVAKAHNIFILKFRLDVHHKFEGCKLQAKDLRENLEQRSAACVNAFMIVPDFHVLK